MRENNRLFVITNRKLVISGSLYNTLERCLSSGADAVILREKDLNGAELLKIAQKIKRITEFYDVPLIVNGNLDVAEKIKAYGYHTGFEGYKGNPVNMNMKLGLSVHSIEEAVEAQGFKADYIIAGNIFETTCKPGISGRGTKFISKIAGRVEIPVIAIGGICMENIRDVLMAGASGAAVMSSAMEDIDGSLVRNIKYEIETFYAREGRK